MDPILSKAPMELQLQLHQHQQMLFRQQQIALRRHQAEDVDGASNGANGANGWAISSLGNGPTLPSHVKVQLQNRKLWQQFHAQTTEMIITKSGRCMFPSVQVAVSGLERRSRYCILLEVVPASDRRHKYVGSGGGEEGNGGDGGSGRHTRGWTSAGPAEPQPHIHRRIYLHPDSPATGAHWMQHSVTFKKLKITNNAADHRNNVVLMSMHKYRVRIWIIRCDEFTYINDLCPYPASAFTFEETEFIAVTAYQNENITKLKIDNNPFAKGFRETGQSRCKRKLQKAQSEVSSRSEDEEENVSSCESECNRTSRTDESRSPNDDRGKIGVNGENGNGDDDDDGRAKRQVCSTRENKESEKSERNVELRLHRPWTDSPPASPTSSVSLAPSTNVAPTNVPSAYRQHPSPIATTLQNFPLPSGYFPFLSSPYVVRTTFHEFQRFHPLTYLPKF